MWLEAYLDKKILYFYSQLLMQVNWINYNQIPTSEDTIDKFLSV